MPTGHGKTLIYLIAVLVARTGKGKILPSNALVVVVSPLNALISDQLESFQRLKLKAVKTSESRQLTLEESSPAEALPRWKRLRPLEDSDDE